MNRVKEYARHLKTSTYNVGACFHSILINTNVNLFTDSLLQANSNSYILYIKSTHSLLAIPPLDTHTHILVPNYILYYITVQRLGIT